MKISELNKIIESYQNALQAAKKELERTWGIAIKKAAEELNDAKSAAAVSDYIHDTWDSKDVTHWEGAFKYALNAEMGKEFGGYGSLLVVADEEYTALVNYRVSGYANVNKVSRKFLAKVIEIAESGKII